MQKVADGMDSLDRQDISDSRSNPFDVLNRRGKFKHAANWWKSCPGEPGCKLPGQMVAGASKRARSEGEPARDSRFRWRETGGHTRVSKPTVLVNLLQTLVAIVLGNVVYFLLLPSLPQVARHRPFQIDLGMVVDFLFCLVAYGLIRTARRWR